MESISDYNAEESQISQFYEGQTVFLTGVTGFLGKILLSKILIQCPKVKKLFLLIRGRRGVSPQARFERDILSLEIFQNIFKKSPHLRDILHVVDGDISMPGLGINEETLEIIQNETTIILHGAATTKFQETMKLALELNSLGAQRVLHLGKQCHNLISHVHVSTAYVNCIHKSGDVEIREKIYPINVNPKEFLEKLEGMTTEKAHEMTDELIHPYPNTYTFTKALGEHLILQDKGNMPVCILRPSIVGCANDFPIRGWVDSMIGANGLLLALGVGALRSMKGKKTNVGDFIPVDMVATMIIAASWRTARQYGTYPPTATRVKGTIPLPIYHCTSSTRNPVLWGWIRHIVEGYFRRRPAKRSVGRPWCMYSEKRITHFLAHTFLHQLPAVIADAKRVLQGKPMKMLDATNRLHYAVNSICFFTDHQWFFANDNVDLLLADMSEVDKKFFPIDIREVDWEIYFVIYSEGIRKFLLKETDIRDDITTKIKSRL